jgi:hypothetical protein
VALFLVVILSIPEPALAYDQFSTGPREENYYVRFNSDPSAGYTMTFNLSYQNNSNLFNYNQTVGPFLNNTTIVGTVTGPWMPPSLVTFQNSSAIYTILASMVQFKSNQVMSGSSYSWWRVPFEDPNVTSCQLKIWKVENPSQVNWTGTGLSKVPNALCHPNLVWSNLYNLRSLTELNKTHYWWNGTSAWVYTHHMAWVRVIAPLHSDISYVYQWIISLPSTVRVYMSLNDIGDDSIYRSWIETDDSGLTTADADLDCTVIHQYGIGDAVSGFEVAANSSLHFYSRLSIPRQSIGRGSVIIPSETEINDGEYLSFMMPFIRDITNTSNVNVNITSEDGHWDDDFWVSTDGETDFGIHTFLYDDTIDDSPCSLFFINVTFQNASNLIFIYDPNTGWDPTYDDESTKATHRFRDMNDPANPDNPYIYFKPYHSLQITNGTWVNTYIYPIYILDGHVIDPQVLRLFDASIYYPWNVNWENAKLQIMGAIGWLGDKLQNLIATIIGVDAQELKDDVARAIQAMGNILYQIGAFLVAAGKWFADNSSFVFAAIFWGIGLIVFVPVWMFLVLFIHGVKTFFLIFARDGPEDAGAYAARFMVRQKKAFNKLALVKGAKRLGNITKKTLG